MYLFDFQSKLKKLNPRLYVNTKEVRHIEGDWRSTGIYLRSAGGRKGRSTGLGEVSNAAQSLLKDTMAGHVDKYIGPVSAGYVPEYEQYKFDKWGEGKILAIGWRTTVLNLIRKGLVDADRAKKVFNCRGLGESSYDKLPGSKKMLWAKENV